MKTDLRDSVTGLRKSYGTALAVAAALAINAGLPATTALAQSDSADEGLGIEEIIVTATRRETSLQDTPLTIQVLGEQELLNIGATDLDDIVGLVPGLYITGEDYTIRGLRSSLSDRSGGSINTTSRYLDETPIDHNFRIYDVARFEVLKGPQGTLYGTGAMGGTIRLVTNKPNPEGFSADLDLDFSSTSSGGSNHEVNAMVNVPLGETLALRAVGYQHDYDGFTDDIRLAINDFDFEEVTGGRVALRWDASENLAITGTFMREDIDAGDDSLTQLQLGDLEAARFFDAFNNETWDVANLLFDWDLGTSNVVVTLTTTENDVDQVFDATAFVNGAFGLPEPPNGGYTNAFQLNDRVFDSDVGEIRWVSGLDGPWNWVVGAFYQKNSASGDGSIIVTEPDPNNPIIGFRVGDLDGFANRDTLVRQGELAEREREQALFGELTYDINEQFSITAGLRYLDVEQSNQGFVISSLFGFPSPLGDPLPSILVEESDTYTKLRLAYKPNEDLLWYFIRSEGFRRGGFNAAAALGLAIGVPNVPQQFSSDEVVNWEVGLHSTWQDGRMVFNSALYFMDWTDIRVGALHPSGLNFTTNGPAADVTGFEAELSYLVTENFNISATLALTDTELTSEAVDGVLAELGVPFPDNLTLAPAGEELPGIPETTFSLALNYNMPDLFAGYDGYARLDTQYTSESFNTYEQGQFSFGRVEMDSYNIANLRLGLVRDTWDVSLYVKNLTDERADLFIDQGGFDPQRVERNRPRTVGVNIRKSFN